jgi:hypothetical protein
VHTHRYSQYSYNREHYRERCGYALAGGREADITKSSLCLHGGITKVLQLLLLQLESLCYPKQVFQEKTIIGIYICVYTSGCLPATSSATCRTPAAPSSTAPCTAAAASCCCRRLSCHCTVISSHWCCAPLCLRSVHCTVEVLALCCVRQL